jgi:hypothetical protein
VTIDKTQVPSSSTASTNSTEIHNGVATQKKKKKKSRRSMESPKFEYETDKRGADPSLYMYQGSNQGGQEKRLVLLSPS